MSEHRVVYSYSHLHRFASCPRLFQLHYIERLPAEDSDASRFGVLLHRTCEAALFEHVACRRCDAIEPASVVRAYREAWEESELGDSLRFEEGLEIAKSWAVRQGCVAWHEVIGIEEPFEIAVGDYRIVGKMDRVSRAGGVVRVREYKTTRVPLTREEVGLIVECKAGKATNPRAALRQAVREAEGRRGMPVAVCKDDRQPATVTMHFDDFVALLREWVEQRLR